MCVCVCVLAEAGEGDDCCGAVPPLKWMFTALFVSLSLSLSLSLSSFFFFALAAVVTLTRVGPRFVEHCHRLLEETLPEDLFSLEDELKAQYMPRVRRGPRVTTQCEWAFSFSLLCRPFTRSVCRTAHDFVSKLSWPPVCVACCVACISSRRRLRL